MTEKVFIIHGWGNSPQEPLHQWLATVLEGRGYEVSVPEMPNPAEPKIDEWVSKLHELVPEVNKKIYFIGHSIGCQTIMRFLETLPTEQKCSVLFLAPWFHLQGLETEEEEKIAAPWLETPINLEEVKKHLRKSAAIFSDGDPYVPLSDRDIFHAAFGTEILVEHEKGHFTGEGGVTKLDSALDLFAKISQP
jgi:uncharacterized protein